MSSIACLVLSATLSVSAQITLHDRFDTLSIPAAKPPFVAKAKPRVWVAVAEVAVINTGLNLFDRYVLQFDYAKVTGTSIKGNLRHQFLWDNDNFDTNLFWHPYTGGLYFNAARANGLTFWQSVPFAVGGSYLWEMLGETQPPSLNDIIATPIGGIALGEMTHRVAQCVLDDSRRGWQRFGRELLAGIISPMDLLNRLLNGDARHHRPRLYDDDTWRPPSPLLLNLAVMNRYIVDMDENRDNFNLALSAGVVYGEPFTEDLRTPYDFFTARMTASIAGNQPLVSAVSIIGLIWGKEWKHKESNWLVGIFQHYDYYNSNPVVAGGKIPYEFAETASFGGGVLFNKPLHRRRPTSLYWTLFVNSILLGANESDYFYVDKRNYNMGNGYSIKSSVAFTKARWNFAWSFKLYQIFTSRGYGSADVETNGLPADADADYVNAQGNKGNTLLGMTGVDVSIHLTKHVRLSAEQHFYFRNTRYAYLPNIKTKSTENCIMLSLYLPKYP
jgi:hypothetical protein